MTLGASQFWILFGGPYFVAQQDVRAGTLEPNWAHVSKRDQFWDQFRGAGSGVKISLVSAFLWYQYFPGVH